MVIGKIIETLTSNRYTEEELREAGASELFIKFYQNAPKEHPLRRGLEKNQDLELISEKPYIGGPFVKHLWKGNETEVIRTATETENKIFRKFL